MKLHELITKTQESLTMLIEGGRTFPDADKLNKGVFDQYHDACVAYQKALAKCATKLPEALRDIEVSQETDQRVPSYLTDSLVSESHKRYVREVLSIFDSVQLSMSDMSSHIKSAPKFFAHIGRALEAAKENMKAEQVGPDFVATDLRPRRGHAHGLTSSEIIARLARMPRMSANTGATIIETPSVSGVKRGRTETTSAAAMGGAGGGSSADLTSTSFVKALRRKQAPAMPEEPAAMGGAGSERSSADKSPSFLLDKTMWNRKTATTNTTAAMGGASARSSLAPNPPVVEPKSPPAAPKPLVVPTWAPEPTEASIGSGPSAASISGVKRGRTASTIGTTSGLESANGNSAGSIRRRLSDERSSSSPTPPPPPPPSPKPDGKGPGGRA